MNDDYKQLVSWLKTGGKPTIHISCEAAAAPLPVGASKIGGQPDMPAGFVWPRRKGGEPFDTKRQWQERPLSFLAQFDFAQVSAFDKDGVLPESGHLAFFYDYEGNLDEGVLRPDCARVFYFPADAALVRTSPPAGMYDDGCASELTLQFSEHFSFPAFSYLPQQVRRALRDAYLWEEIWPQEWGCKLLGWADVLETAPEEECFRTCDVAAAIDPEAVPYAHAGDWRLLLQLGELYLQDGAMFSDLGALYFMIRRQDLAAQKFDNIRIVRQDEYA